MDDSEDELLIATSCLLLATASRLSITLNLLPRRRRTVWVLGTKLSEKMNKYSVYRSGGAKTSRQPFPGQYCRKAGHSRLTFCSK